MVSSYTRKSVSRSIIMSFILLALVGCSESIELNSANLINLRGPINELSVNDVIEKMVLFDGSVLYIYINSPGGSVLQGMKIIDQIEALKKEGVEVNCIADYSASMAFVILQTCSRRYATKSSVLMQHQMSLGVEGNIHYINSYIDYVNHINLDLIEMQSERIGLTCEEFDKKIMNDWWISGNHATKMNVVDELITVNCHSQLITKHEMFNIDTIFGRIVLTYSKCPLLRNPINITWDNNELKYGDVIQLVDNFMTNQTLNTAIKSNRYMW